MRKPKPWAGIFRQFLGNLKRNAPIDSLGRICYAVTADDGPIQFPGCTLSQEITAHDLNAVYVAVTLASAVLTNPKQVIFSLGGFDIQLNGPSAGSRANCVIKDVLQVFQARHPHTKYLRSIANECGPIVGDTVRLNTNGSSQETKWDQIFTPYQEKNQTAWYLAKAE